LLLSPGAENSMGNYAELISETRWGPPPIDLLCLLHKKLNNNLTVRGVSLRVRAHGGDSSTQHDGSDKLVPIPNNESSTIGELDHTKSDLVRRDKTSNCGQGRQRVLRAVYLAKGVTAATLTERTFHNTPRMRHRATSRTHLVGGME